MVVKDNFKVVIAGGSITGLALANMLQLYNIDFVVLEAYPDIAPQVGASIGILPHGNRILDQLGLFQNILDLCPPLDSLHFRKQSGHVIREFRGMNASMYERHGYPIVFLDRQMVLQVLYDNIKDKTKILTNKRVNDVELSDDSITVHTIDGSSYLGDVLVGADGIHSTVRKEMWRIANKEAPGWIPSTENTAVPCDFGCIFGISNPCGIEPGSSNSVFKKHQSYIVNGGPAGRVYWFFFWKLPKRTYGKDIPAFSKEDEKKLLAERADDNITPTITFKTLLDNRVSSNMLPLQEYVFKKWYYKRVITLGDSAHKFHPIAGHGGNACIESAATFVNELRRALAESKGRKPRLEQVEKVFSETQRIRQARTMLLKEHSHNQQRTELLDTPLHELLALHLLPRTDDEDITFNFSRNIPLAEKLDSHDLRPVPKLVPYKDELLSVPSPRGMAKWYFMAFYLAIAGLVHYGMWVWSAHYELGKHIGEAVTTGSYSYDPSFTLKRTYIGIKAIDEYLVFLAAVFMPGLKNWDPHFSTLQMYFLGMLVQPIAVWTVEAFRRRNTLTPLSIISLWLTLVQSAGIGIYMPIYYAVYTFISEPEPYWWPLNREVPLEYATVLTWAVNIGYTLPTILMFLPWSDPNVLQNFEALWQVSPMLAPALCSIFGYYYAKTHNISKTSRKRKQTAPDLPHLKKLYIFTGLLGLLLHIYIITKIVLTQDLTLASVFWPDFSALAKPFGEGLRALFLADFWGFYVASYIWLCMAAWDLKRVGRITVNVSKVSALIALGYFVIGPGATMSAVWYWRECALAMTIF